MAPIKDPPTRFKEAGPDPHADDVRISGAHRLRRRLELWKCTLHEVEGQLRVVATGNIGVGECAFASKPYATFLLSRNERTHCAQCMQKFPEDKPPKRCGRCRAARYCGLDCQRAAWKGHHRVECGSLGDLRKELAAPNRDVEGELLDAALASRCLRKIVDDEKAGAADYEMFGKFTAAEAAAVDVMNAARVADSGQTNAAGATLVAPGDAASGGGMDDADAPRLANAARRAKAAPRDARLEKLLRASPATHFMIQSETLSGLGVGSFPLGSAVRHSCLPNCSVVYDFCGGKEDAAKNLEQRFIAMTPIKAGDELTRAWVDPMSATWLRHHRLKTVYGSVVKPTSSRPRDKPCDCARCCAPWSERDALIEGDREMAEVCTKTASGKAALDSVAESQRRASEAGSVEEQGTWLEKGMDTLNAKVAPCHPAVLAILEMLMANALARGKNQEAISLSKRLVSARERLYAPRSHTRVVLDYFMLAEIILQDARGDPAKGLVARPYLVTARDLARKVHGKKCRLANKACHSIELIDGDIRAVNAPERSGPQGRTKAHKPMPEIEGGYPRSYAATRETAAPKCSPDLLTNPPTKRSTEEYYVPEEPLPGILDIPDEDLDSASDYSIDD